MEQILSLSFYSAKAVVTVLLICLAGAILVRYQFIKEEALRILSKLVFTIMFPALLFSAMAPKTDFAALKEFWIFPVTCALFVVLGLGLGYIVAKVTKTDSRFFNMVIACCTFGNTSFMPIPLVSAVALVVPAFAAIPGAERTGIFYISLYLILFSPLAWTIGFAMLSGRKLTDMKLADLINPPIIGMVLGLIVGLIPPLRDSFCVKTGLMSPFFESAEIIGKATVPCALLVLGGRLSHCPVHNDLPKMAVALTAFVKLILMPVICVGFVYSMIKFGLMPRDPIMALVLILEAAVPPATSLIVMCAIQENDLLENNMASLCFWNYIFAIPTITFFIILSLWLFQ